MAISLLRNQNLLTTARHILSNGAKRNQYHRNSSLYNRISNSSTKQRYMYDTKYYYSRFSNFRKSGKDVYTPVARPVVLPSHFTGFSTFSGLCSRVFARIGFVSWYLGKIESRPLITKSLTSFSIYVVADLTSQTISLPSTEPYDLIRTSRMAGYGLVIVGPALHYWFNFMSKILPGRDLLTTAKKMFLGQSVCGPIMTVLFFSLNAALQGENAVEIYARLRRDFLPTTLNGVIYWPLCDFITFRFVPVHLQPLASNGFSFVWTIYITYIASLEKVVE